ncbi:MAG: hypothetical protein M1833_005265 [Piccolia ochrophora]|nr:MAG: hypothetical protein M1833_005265 [Piccolia ochrophora]
MQSIDPTPPSGRHPPRPWLHYSAHCELCLAGVNGGYLDPKEAHSFVVAGQRQPANRVFVTGTFDDWSGNAYELEKNSEGVFERRIDLPKSEEKVHYKYVVDGNWTIDTSAAQENDAQSNINNVLGPSDMTSSDDAGAGTANISSAAPESTTAGLAKDVPVENKTSNDHSGMPGFFPETPQHEQTEFSVNPIPATAGSGNPVQLAPGEKVPDPSTFTSNTVSSTAHDDTNLSRKDQKDEPSFGVAPLPATSGAGNPINLKPGEKVPDSGEVTANTINSTVTTDKESYEKAGSASMGPPALPPSAKSQKPSDQEDAKNFTLPPISKGMIPESSLPMGGDSAGDEQNPGVTINSAGPSSTTAGLAGNVPLESKRGDSAIPTVVKDSEAQTDIQPSSEKSPELLKEKGALEQEILGQVREAPSTSEGTAKGGHDGTTDKSEDGKASDKATQESNTTASSATKGVAASVSQSIGKINSDSDAQVAVGVPSIAKESLAEAHQSPEAAGNKEAVDEKAEVERELLKDIKPAQESGEPAPTITSTQIETAPAPTKPEGSGLAASAASPAATPATKDLEASPQATGLDSRDVSPMTRDPTTEHQPIVTTGVGESTTETKQTPQKGKEHAAPVSPAQESIESTPTPPGGTSKKDKRRSFFGKLKEKLKK